VVAKAAVGSATIKAMRRRTREIRKSKVQCYYYGQGYLLHVYYIYIHIYIATMVVSLLLPLYTYTAAATAIATAAFPADDALGRLDNDNDAFRTMMCTP